MPPPSSNEGKENRNYRNVTSLVLLGWRRRTSFLNLWIHWSFGGHGASAYVWLGRDGFDCMCHVGLRLLRHLKDSFHLLFGGGLLVVGFGEGRLGGTAPLPPLAATGPAGGTRPCFDTELWGDST